jgi:hypothetical protein
MYQQFGFCDLAFREMDLRTYLGLLLPYIFYWQLRISSLQFSHLGGGSYASHAESHGHQAIGAQWVEHITLRSFLIVTERTRWSKIVVGQMERVRGTEGHQLEHPTLRLLEGKQHLGGEDCHVPSQMY